MKQLVAVFVVLVGLSVALTLTVDADDQNQTVQTTVSPEVVAISVSDTSLDYGSLPLGSTGNLPDPAFFTVTNAGTENVSLDIRGYNTDKWILGASAGEDQFVHWYGTRSDSITGKLTTSDQDFFPALMANPGGTPGSVEVYLALDMPTSTTSFATQTASVTIVATKLN